MKTKNLWYSLILGLILSFCFGTSAFAATSSVDTSFTISSGETLNIRGQTFTNTPYDEMTYYEDGNNIYEAYKWNLSENVIVRYFNDQKYYSGWIYFQIKVTPSNSNIDINNWRLQNTFITDGLYMYIGGVSSNSINVRVVFDNYKPSSDFAPLNTITFQATNNTTDNNITISPNFAVTLTLQGSSLYGYDGAVNNSFTAQLYSAISQATGSDLASIINMLTDIRNQDYTYYTQITNQLASIISNQNYSYQALLDIIDELDTDFANVQTVLDLFPSYRLQVLQYWQEFLEMNAAESAEAAEQESKYADGESQANNMVSNMEAVGLPSISNGDLDILGTVDGTQKNNFFGVIALITHTEIVTKIMLIIVIGAMVGFIMYGKKGG